MDGAFFIIIEFPLDWLDEGLAAGSTRLTLIDPWVKVVYNVR